MGDILAGDIDDGDVVTYANATGNETVGIPYDAQNMLVYAEEDEVDKEFQDFCTSYPRK